MTRSPPIESLECLETLLDGRSSYGRAIDKPELLEKAKRLLCETGRLQTIVLGHHIAWYNTRASLRNAACERLCRNASVPEDIYSNLVAVFSKDVRKHEFKVERMCAATPQEMKRERLLRKTAVTFVTGRHEYKALPKEWFEARARFQELNNELDRQLIAAILEGRLICAQLSGSGATILHPKEAAKQSKRNRFGQLQYSFTEDLPAGFFGEGLDKAKRRRNAAAWMEKVLSVAIAKGKQARSEDMRKIAESRYGLTPNGAKEAWRNVPENLKPGSGRISKHRQMTREEVEKVRV